MENVFFKQFLMISDIKTIVFLAVLVGLFYLIHVLYHKKHMDFAVVVMVGTGLGLVLAPGNPVCCQFSGCSNGCCVRCRDNNLVCNGRQRLHQPYQDDCSSACYDFNHAGYYQHAEGKAMSQLVKNTIIITMGMVLVASVTGIVIGMLFGVGKEPP